jgi:hypothetical protein
MAFASMALKIVSAPNQALPARKQRGWPRYPATKQRDAKSAETCGVNKLGLSRRLNHAAGGLRMSLHEVQYNFLFGYIILIKKLTAKFMASIGLVQD